MRWTADVSRGDWIAPRLQGWGVVGGTVPRGFEAYVRVFHPVPLDRVLSWEPSIEVEERIATWREITERFGTTWHPRMQWKSISRNVHEQHDIGDGWRLNAPAQGRLELDTLASLARLLSDATGTSAEIVAGIWRGYGELRPATAGILVARTASARERRIAEKAARTQLVELVDPDVTRASESGPTLSLPAREYVLLTTSVGELSDPSWIDDAGLGGSSRWHLTPNLLWTKDRAWFLASEIDFDSTIIGGSRALIDSILAASALESAEVDEDTSLASDADTVNGNPAPGV